MENRNIKKGSMIKANNRSIGRFVKYVSRLLALVILLTSVLAFSGCDILSEKKEMQIKEDYVSQFNITDVAPEDVVVDYYAGNWNGYEIIMLDAECHRREVWEEKIGDVTLTYYDSNRLYAWSEGGFITLTDAYASNKLSMKDLERISKKFNKDVRYYIDICDKYDFEKGSISNQYEWDGNTIYDKLDVWISREFLQDMANMSDWAPIIDHLGNRVIKSVLDMKILSDCLVIFVELRINSKAFMEKASIQISEVPGVYLVGPYETECFVYSAGGDTSGNTISDPLKDIEVEKVWDFTTGSDDVLVGIVDMGVDCSHPNLRDTVIYEMDYSVNKENFTIDIQHGTLVAGIIGSNYINDIGNIAVNKKIKIMSFLVDDEQNNNHFEKMLPV